MLFIFMSYNIIDACRYSDKCINSIYSVIYQCIQVLGNQLCSCLGTTVAVSVH